MMVCRRGGSTPLMAAMIDAVVTNKDVDPAKSTLADLFLDNFWGNDRIPALKKSLNKSIILHP